ncbi:MAG: DUF4097 family beta strand repeat protein [Clostridia bacterium]|nr:DUF4097 family beta strand repeat protein [Clostridia bacterium]
MKRIMKTFTKLGVCLFLVGSIIFTTAMFAACWDWSKLSNIVYEDKTYTVSADEVDKIALDIESGKLEIEQTDDENITVEYYIGRSKNGKERISIKPSLSDGVLTIKQKVGFVIFNFTEKKAVVKIPADKTLELSAEVASGEITLGNVEEQYAFSSLKLNVTSGEICVNSAVTAEKVSMSVTSGEISIKNAMTSAGNVSIKVTSGDVEINGALTAENISMSVTSGDIDVNSEVTATSATLSVTSGKIDAYGGVLAADKVEAKVSSGDIKIAMKGKKEVYSYTCKVGSGDSNISSYIAGDKTIKATVSSGDIHIKFKE